MRTLQEIAEAHYSGYLVHTDYFRTKTVFSFCNKRLQSVRKEGIILSSINTKMDSGSDNQYVICDKYGNSLESLKHDDKAYRIKLGYIS